jgi:hypothetical protein
MGNMIRIGDVPLEWFTGVGELRSHDRACNHLTARDILMRPRKEKPTGFTKGKKTARSKAISKNCTHTLISNGVKSIMVEGILNKKDTVKYGNYAGYKLIRYVK